MANVTSLDKLIDVDLLSHFKEKQDAANKEAYVGQEAGKGLVNTEEYNGVKSKVDALDTTYVKEEGFDDKVKGVVGTVYRAKGSKENLEAIKAVETPAEGDVYNATDTGANYVYVGEGQGEDESGWDKLSETVDLSGYITTTTADGKYAEKNALQSLQETVEGLDSTYAKDEELTTAINGLESTYVKIENCVVAEEADIDALFTE